MWFPLVAEIIGVATNGPATHLEVAGPRSAGKDLRPKVRQVLRQAGIPVWAMTPDLRCEYIMFSVPKDRAMAAYNALVSAGIDVLKAPSGVKQDRKYGLTDSIFSMLDW